MASAVTERGTANDDAGREDRGVVVGSSEVGMSTADINIDHRIEALDHATAGNTDKINIAGHMDTTSDLIIIIVVIPCHRRQVCQPSRI